MESERVYEWSNAYNNRVCSSDESTNTETEINLAVRADKIYKRAQEVYRKTETLNLSAGADDKNDFYDMQSTPCYSELSFEHLTKLPANVPEREHRVLVVVLLSITFFLQMFSRDFCVPFFEPTSIVLPQGLQTPLSLFPIWNIVVGVLLTIPACVGINKYGIRTCLLYSCALSSFGVGVRCLSTIGDSTFVLHVSAVFLSSASVVVKPLTVTVSTCCFLTGERNTATGFLTCASMAGAAAGLLVTTVLRQEQPYPQPAITSEHMRINNMIILYLSFVANLVCLLFAYFVFPHEPRKRKHCDQSTETKQKYDVPSAWFLLQTVFKSIQNSDLVYVALSYACSNALSWPWYQMIDITYSKVGFPQTVGKDCRLWMIIHACVLSLSVCWLADRIVGSSKRLGILCHSLATVFMLWVVLALCVKILRRRTNSLVFGVMFAFPLSWTTQSLLYELAADYAHPLPESMAVGLICLLETSCESCMYFILYAFPKFHLYWLHVFTFIAGLLSVIFIILIKGKKFDRYYN
ncbi:uncharacterized protein LOC132921369 isoform X2 [Rhopalosiphum padi]|uniref:uncharacterized protein LOC132921369 isoform X2 n=1 Tax=Rhopalosiphum padi TaxID=40932 RepID=UPI00298E81F9|nr:uncharacterized protein LOC132921369 isoform X2 [Rhopalosiphum padi]